MKSIIIYGVYVISDIIGGLVNLLMRCTASTEAISACPRDNWLGMHMEILATSNRGEHSHAISLSQVLLVISVPTVEKNNFW